MNWETVRSFLVEVGEEIADYAFHKLSTESSSELSAVHTISNSDTIYQIDSHAEEVIVQRLEERAHEFGGIVLVAEGIGENEISFYPKDTPEQNCVLRIIMDPIDGTRGLMYNKRSAFFLAGAAKNLGANTKLSDIHTAAMVEIPTSKMFLADSLSAIKNEGTRAHRRNIFTKELQSLEVCPSEENHLKGGFAQFARFFSPGRKELADIEETLLEDLYPNAKPGEILNFEDQYISTGGQLYEVLTGKDRFTADIRPALFKAFPHLRKGHVCHPYDMAALLVAEEAGIIVTDISGNTLDAPMDTDSPVDWIVYANENLRKIIQPMLNRILKKNNFSL